MTTTPVTTIGAMREQVVLLQRTATTKDTHGADVVTFDTLDSVSAELMPVRAGERLQANTIQALVEVRFRIRARTDVTPGMRVAWRPSWSTVSTQRQLEIHGVQAVGDGRTYTVLECGEVAA